MWNAHNTVLGSKHLPIYMCHLTQCRLCWGLPLYQVAFWSIQLFGHNRHRPKVGASVPLMGELGSHLTQCGLGRNLPAYQMAHWSIQPFATIDVGQNVRTAVLWLLVLIMTSEIGYRRAVTTGGVFWMCEQPRNFRQEFDKHHYIVAPSLRSWFACDLQFFWARYKLYIRLD